MHGRVIRYISAFFLFLAGFAFEGKAQFKEEAFQQTYNDSSDSTAVADTADKLFSFKEWGRGIAHKQEIEIGTMFAGSVFAPGTAQIYNRDSSVCPFEGIVCCATVVTPQTEHFLPSVRPASVQVAALPATVTSVCPFEGITSVLTSPQEQVRVLVPASVHVGCFVILSV